MTCGNNDDDDDCHNINLITQFDINQDILAQLYVTYQQTIIGMISCKNFNLDREDDFGFIEYKRSIVNCSNEKIERYATQMRWRISENINNFAVYYIGVDDDGKIIGLSDSELFESIQVFFQISNTIEALIECITIINTDHKNIVSARVKLNNLYIYNNIIDFD